MEINYYSYMKENASISKKTNFANEEGIVAGNKRFTKLIFASL
jgi:hypothetical protein